MKMATNVKEEPMPQEALNPLQTTDITYAPTETATELQNEVTNINNNNNNNNNNDTKSNNNINNDNNKNAVLITIKQKKVIEPQEESSANGNRDKQLPETKITISAVVGKNEQTPLPAPKLVESVFHEAAAGHGADETTSFIDAEINSTQQQIQQQQIFQKKLRSTSDATVSRNPSAMVKHEKKIGHRRVDDEGEVTYKRIQSKQIMGSIQLGIQHTVGSLASKPKRDLLMNDFWEIETISFPPDGSSITPAHHYSDFKFKVYAPIAFRYFRDLFGIAPDDFLMSMCASPLCELSNPGASGSLFYLTADDEFIIKTVQKKEGDFLQKLLPGYYMNLSQNPRTLLPKFFGLYCFNYNTKNVRLVAMNNILPSEIKMHAKYDLKGSTFRRKASKQERQKNHPVFKDLDFMDHHPNGIFLETDKYNALIKTIQRDCMVLESFQIMDYSLLVGIHNLDLAAKEKREERIRNARSKLQRNDDTDISVRAVNDVLQDKMAQMSNYNPAAAVAAAAASVSTIGIAAASTSSAAGSAMALNRSRSMNRQRLVAHSTAMESITADMDLPLEEDDDVPAGGIPARSENDERLILYIGIIDILQSYRLEKKLEHTFKSIIYNGDTVSVCRPSFYSQRFQHFMSKTVFKKTPTFPLKHSPSKRKTSTTSGVLYSRTPVQRTPSQSFSGPSQSTRIQLNMGTSTPPPAFDDISEEELTATSSSGYNRHSTKTNSLSQQRVLRISSYNSSNQQSICGDDYSDDDLSTYCSVPSQSPMLRPSPHLSTTGVQVTSIGLDDCQDMPNQTTNKQIIVINNNNNDNNGVICEKLIASNDNVGDVVVIRHREEESDQLKTVSTVKTAIIKPVSQPTYTSTLVVNDVVR